MCRLRDNLVVFGGRNRFSFVPSVYLLDICTLVWLRIEVRSRTGEAMDSAMLQRSEFSTAVSRYEDRIFIFGGIDSKFVLTN